MHERLAQALLIHTGYAISAVVSLGEENEILEVFLFDTIWQAKHMRFSPASRRIDLISNHPCGEATPYNEDFENLKRLKKLSSAEVRLILVSEYFSSREITPRSL